MAALYAFARITDDLGDSNTSNDDKRDRLFRWQSNVHEFVGAGRRCEAAEGNGAHTMLWPALADTVQRFQIPAQLLDDIVKGVQMDVGPVSITDWPQLNDYCYHVASAVGLACTCIWQSRPALPSQAAIDCGIAFQLTNILRDVREDALQGRIYIPICELERFGCDRATWLSGKPNGDWAGCINSVACRASELYLSGWQTALFLHADGRRMFSLIWRTYRQLLNRVVCSTHTLWSGSRITVPKATQFKLAISHFVPWWYQILPAPVPVFAPPGTEVIRGRFTSQ